MLQDVETTKQGVCACFIAYIRRDCALGGLNLKRRQLLPVRCLGYLDTLEMSKRQPWKNINLSSSQAWFIESSFHIFFKILFANGVITVFIHSVCSFAQSVIHSLV